MTKLDELHKLGQSVWYDNIQRSLLENGGLAELVARGVRGVTSNPSIFDKAISGSTEYDAEISRLAGEGKDAEAIYEALALADIAQAADILRSVYDESTGEDGYVSLEVSPNLAHDTEATIAAAKRLFAALERPNIMIKVPATPAGIPAIRTLIGAGININVTLIFDLQNYVDVAEAYIAGLEDYAASGGDLRGVASVASFFVSRVDTAVDNALIAAGNNDLQGKIAVANAKVAYARFQELFNGPRWEALAGQGARVQRPLWASTSTKNPAYPDTLYVDTLIGPHTVNTMPPKTVTAFNDHGTVAATLVAEMAAAADQISRLAAVGIDLAAITEQLQADGVKAFADAFSSLLQSVEEKAAALQES